MSAPSESTEAKALATYLNALVEYKQIICYTKTAQETWTNSWGVKMRQKSEGVQKGIPDYIILTKQTLLFIELKKQKGVRGGSNGSKLSLEQELWVKTIDTLYGDKVHATVACGADEAIKYIKKYI